MNTIAEVVGLMLCGAGLFVLGWVDGRQRSEKRWRNVAQWYREQVAREEHVKRARGKDLSVN